MRWIRRKWSWAKKNPLFWANLVLALATWLLIWVFPGPVLETGPSDLRLRTWGAFLQLLGVLTVWHDLAGTAGKFGKGGFVVRTAVWLKEFFGGITVLTATGVASCSSIGRGRAKVRHPVRDGASTEERLSDLEKNVGKIDEDLDGAFREIDQRSAELDTKITEEKREREQAVRKVRDDLEEAATGNFAVLAFGAAWLAVGILLSTLAPEIAKVVGGKCGEVLQAF
jgi:hypothetical protein